MSIGALRCNAGVARPSALGRMLITNLVHILTRLCPRTGGNMETTTKTSERQETQEELLEKAKALPGVKEAAEVYGRVTRHIGDQPAVTTKVTSYATGGNAS